MSVAFCRPSLGAPARAGVQNCEVSGVRSEAFVTFIFDRLVAREFYLRQFQRVICDSLSERKILLDNVAPVRAYLTRIENAGNIFSWLCESIYDGPSRPTRNQPRPDCALEIDCHFVSLRSHFAEPCGTLLPCLCGKRGSAPRFRVYRVNAVDERPAHRQRPGAGLRQRA